MRAGRIWRIAALGLALATGVQGVHAAGFKVLTNDQWDTAAVRRVLHTFAYGSQASEAQIQAWADMSPSMAIGQMLTFTPHNLLLSPGEGDAMQGGVKTTLRNLQTFWASSSKLNDTPLDRRSSYLPGGFDVAGRVWGRLVRTHGLNPFRARIGLWETNDHLAVNVYAGVSADQAMQYYDDVTDSLSANAPYQEVLARAASSAAIARQYGHAFNRWSAGKCYCNEDFAREFHQLFFGVLGDYDPVAHETVTIKNTARALTDMAVDAGATQVTFGTAYHDADLLEER